MKVNELKPDPKAFHVWPQPGKFVYDSWNIVYVNPELTDAVSALWLARRSMADAMWELFAPAMILWI